MPRSRLLPVWMLVCTLWCVTGFSQTAEQKGQLSEQLKRLQTEINTLPPNDRATVDATICSKAVEWLLRHDEFFKGEANAKQAEQVLKLGQERVAAIRAKKVAWGKEGRTALGFRSAVDDSVQPYVLSLPKGYGSDANKKWPLFVVLHGRQGTTAEVQTIADAIKADPPLPADYIQLNVYARGNNAYRWAGETDVFEAIEDVKQRFPIDDQRITIWGFSMGGAGGWQFAVHHPSRWASAGAGAGFIDYYVYQKKTDKLPPHQHRALRIYDAIDYAENLNAVPMIGYGGQFDAQLASARRMYEESVKLNVPLSVLVGAGMGHKFDPSSQATFQQFLKSHNSIGLKDFPGRRDFRFVTYTLKYNECNWMRVEEMEVPYEATRVVSAPEPEEDPARATRNAPAAASKKKKEPQPLKLTTQNVAAFSMWRGAGDKIQIDKSEVFSLPKGDPKTRVYFVKEAGKWKQLSDAEGKQFAGNPQLHKRHNLQGPIDDAFMESFVNVKGTGTPWSPELQKYADWSLARHEREFDKWMRANPRVKTDKEITAADIENSNLILFGDPGSNSVLAKVVDKLPLKWTKDQISFQGKNYSTKDHAVVLIFPNPLNPQKYVVINSGMSMHDPEFAGTNALLFPRLGDHAVLKVQADSKQGYTETPVAVGFFDSAWKFEPAAK